MRDCKANPTSFEGSHAHTYLLQNVEFGRCQVTVKHTDAQVAYCAIINYALWCNTPGEQYDLVRPIVPQL